MTFEEWVAAVRAKVAALNQVASEIDALLYDIPPVTPPPQPVIEEATGEGGGESGGGAATGFVPAPAFVISGPDVVEITETSAVVEWYLSMPGDGSTFYGVNPSALNLSRVETRLLTYHRQRLANLQPGTTYHYRVVSKNAIGTVLSLPTRSFKTAVPLPDKALAETFLTLADAPPTIRETPATFMASSGQMAVAGIDEGRINYE